MAEVAGSGFEDGSEAIADESEDVGFSLSAIAKARQARDGQGAWADVAPAAREHPGTAGHEHRQAAGRDQTHEHEPEHVPVIGARGDRDRAREGRRYYGGLGCERQRGGRARACVNEPR